MKTKLEWAFEKEEDHLKNEGIFTVGHRQIIFEQEFKAHATYDEQELLQYFKVKCEHCGFELGLKFHHMVCTLFFVKYVTYDFLLRPLILTISTL